MKIATINFENCFVTLRCDYELLYPYGLDITYNEFFELVDQAFIDRDYRDIKSLTIFNNLSGYVPTDPLYSMLSRNVDIINYYLSTIIPNEFMVLPDSVYYVEGARFKLMWSENHV